MLLPKLMSQIFTYTKIWMRGWSMTTGFMTTFSKKILSICKTSNIPKIIKKKTTSKLTHTSGEQVCPTLDVSFPVTAIKVLPDLVTTVSGFPARIQISIIWVLPFILKQATWLIHLQLPYTKEEVKLMLFHFLKMQWKSKIWASFLPVLFLFRVKLWGEILHPIWQTSLALKSYTQVYHKWNSHGTFTQVSHNKVYSNGPYRQLRCLWWHALQQKVHRNGMTLTW